MAERPGDRETGDRKTTRGDAVYTITRLPGARRPDTRMLPRTLEPEVMDSDEDARDYDTMDHREVNRRFVDDLLAAELLEPGSSTAGQSPALPGGQVELERHLTPGQSPGLPEAASQDLADDDYDFDREPLRVLDIGTGTAQIPIELCRRTPDVRVMAMDAAISMLELARLNVELASLRDQIQLDRTDAKAMHYRDAMFDAVISNSILHHVAEPRSVLSEAIRVAKPGALLFFRDLLRPDDEAALAQLVAIYAADCNEHQRSLFAASLRAGLTLDEVRALVGSFGYAPETVQQTSDRHWTWVTRKASGAA